MLLIFLVITLLLSQTLHCANRNQVLIRFGITKCHLLFFSFPNRKRCSDDPDSQPCLFQFLFVIPTEDGGIYQEATEFAELNDYLSHKDELGSHWNKTYEKRLPSKPLSLNIFLLHSGTLISRSDEEETGVTHVGIYSFSLKDILPTISVTQKRTYELEGKNAPKPRMGFIEVSVSLVCLGQLIGPSCDLNCTKSAIDSKLAQCTSSKTGYLSICQYISSGQVHYCEQCPWGVKNGTYCQAEPEKMMMLPQVAESKHFEVMFYIFMGSSAVLAGLLVYVVCYRGVKPKENFENPVFELLSVEEMNE